jgi:hypothetical protein
MYYILASFKLPYTIYHYHRIISNININFNNKEKYRIIKVCHTKRNAYEYIERLINSNELTCKYVNYVETLKKLYINIHTIKIIEEHDIFDIDLYEIIHKHYEEPTERIENTIFRKLRIDVEIDYTIMDDILSIYHFNEDEKIMYDDEIYRYDNLPINLQQIIIYEYSISNFGNLRKQNVEEIKEYFKKIPFGCKIKVKTI